MFSSELVEVLYDLRNSQYANLQFTLGNMWVEFLHYSDFQSDDNDLEKTLHCHKKGNFVQRNRKLTQTHTHRFSIYAIVISQTILCEGCNSNMCPLFLKEIDAVQPTHSLHFQIFVSFINKRYLCYLLPVLCF